MAHFREITRRTALTGALCALLYTAAAPAASQDAADYDGVARFFWNGLRCVASPGFDHDKDLKQRLRDNLVARWDTPRPFVADLQEAGRRGLLEKYASLAAPTELCGASGSFGEIVRARVQGGDKFGDDPLVAVMLASPLLADDKMTKVVTGTVMSLKPDEVPQDWAAAFDEKTGRMLLDRLLLQALYQAAE